MEDWAEIRRLHRAEGMAIKAIARRLGISRNAVRRALARDQPPRYSRPAKGSVVDAVEPRIRELLRETPTMPATVIAERIGWQHGLTVLKDRVRSCGRTTCRRTRPRAPSYEPGHRVQCDLWFPPAAVPLGSGQAGLAAGAGDDVGLLADAVGGDDPVAAGAGPDRRALAAAAAPWVRSRGSWSGTTRARSACWRRGKPTLTERVRRLPRRAGDRGAPVPAPGSGGQGPDRAQQRLLRDLVPARPHVHRPRRLQHPARPAG